MIDKNQQQSPEPHERPTPESPGGAGRTAYVLFRLADANFAVEASLCKGVVRKNRIAKLPETPEYVLGVCRVQGEVVSVTDPGELLGLPRRCDGSGGYLLILKSGALKTALWVDWVNDVVEMEADRIGADQSRFPSAPRGVVSGRSFQFEPPTHVLDGRMYLEATAVRRPGEKA